MRKISFLLAILLLASSFLMTACKKDEPKETTPAGTTPTATTPAATTPEVTTKPEENPPVVHASILVENLSNYDIVSAKGSSNEVSKMTKTLQETMQSVYQIPISLKTANAYNVKDYEILVGDTGREESQAFLSDLKWDDYGYGIVGDKLVIAGKNEDGTFAALCEFILQFATNADSEVFFSNENQSIERAVYPYETITVNGIAAEDLSILCNQQELGGVAQIFRDAIIDACGIAVPIITDADVKEGDKLFVIGASAHVTEDAWVNPFKGNDYSIHSNENLIWLNANTTAGYLSAVYYISALLWGKDGDTVVLKQNHYEGMDAIGVMSFNLMAGKESERLDAVVETILKYRPAVVGVQEATDMWIGLLNQRLGDIYTIVGDGRNADRGDEHSAILYLTAEFDCLESGTKWLSETPDVPGSQHSTATSKYPRIMTYVHLSRKSDGKEFLHVNTHLDYGTTPEQEAVKVAQIEVLFSQIEKFADLPTIVTGDFNATVGSPVYNRIGDEGYLEVAHYIPAEDREPTYHALMGTTGEPSHIDFVFCKGVSNMFHRICTERVDNENVSDHYPIFAVLEFYPNGK